MRLQDGVPTIWGRRICPEFGKDIRALEQQRPTDKDADMRVAGRCTDRSDACLQHRDTTFRAKRESDHREPRFTNKLGHLSVRHLPGALNLPPSTTKEFINNNQTKRGNYPPPF